MSAVTTYCIGGIATNELLYAYPMAHIPGSVYLPFPEHSAKDTLGSYARKFMPLIDTSKPFHLVANSMGGMMAMELCKHIRPEKIVLVSSVKCRAEMPWRLRQLKYSKLHKLVSGKTFIAGVHHGSRFVREIYHIPGLRDIVIEMARQNRPDFLQWCVHAIVNWDGAADYRKDIIHLHGTRDNMFPIKNLEHIIPVDGGSHNMLLTRKE